MRARRRIIDVAPDYSYVSCGRRRSPNETTAASNFACAPGPGRRPGDRRRRRPSPCPSGRPTGTTCLTYDGPSRGEGTSPCISTVRSRGRETRGVDTGDANALRFGADAWRDRRSRTRYGITHGLTAPPARRHHWPPTAVPGSVPTVPSPAPPPLPSPAPSPLPSLVPTISPAPTTHEYEYDLVAYYPMTHGKLDDAHTSGYHGKAWRPINLTSRTP